MSGLCGVVMTNSMKLTPGIRQGTLFQHLSFSIILIFSVMILSGCDILINIMAFHPDNSDVIPTERLPSTVHELFIDTDDNIKIQSYFIPNKVSEKIVIYFHGNAGNISHRLYDLMRISDFGINVLAISYRGYGKSQGRPDEKGIYTDGKAALDYSRRILGFENDKIFVLGRSIGTAVAIESAQNLNIAGLILVSPLTSGRAQAKVSGLGLVAFLAGNAFNNIDKMDKIICPVLVIHGTEDKTIPFEMGMEIYNRIQTEKRFIKIQGANHNNLSTEYDERYWASVYDFVYPNKAKKRKK